jgi:beta-glucosidase
MAYASKGNGRGREKAARSARFYPSNNDEKGETNAIMTVLRRPYTLLLFLVTIMGAAPPDDIEARIDALLARMTLDEKVGQMSQSTSMQTPISDRIKQEIRIGRWGSFLNAGSPADRAEAQRIARQESRLGIPLLFGRDVVHGYRTIFPIPLGQSASWDPELISQAARIAAREATNDGIRWTFAPMIDITRDPRWGRVAETLGEDPYLTGALGVAMIHGFQGESLDEASSMAACAKHYAGYGAAEAGRDYNSTWIPEILLREVYLRPFHAARDAGVASIMTAFNALNGVPATGNRFTIHEILREEWKFDGLVVSDYESVTEMIQHGYAADAGDAALKAVRAGVDMEMVSSSYFDHLKSLLQAGKIDMQTIDESVRHVLRLKFRLGLFDSPRPLTAPAKLARVEPDALACAQRLAAESVVLLKNEGSVLPLASSTARIAVIGPLADSPVDQMGTWVMDGRSEDTRTPLATLRERLGSERIAYAQALKNSRDSSREGFGAAVKAAQTADVVLLFLGEEQILSGEARSRAFLNLPGAQEELVSEIAKIGKPMVAVILAGRPLTFHAIAEKASAILYAWHPGTMGGPAIADLLFGQAAPSGKLTITFPRTVGQTPIYYAHLNTGRAPSLAELGIPMGTPAKPTGYTSKYIDVDFTPEYPFGYGLSYTTFQYSDLRVSAPRLRRGGRLTVSAEVRNRGAREADEVVQLYVRNLVASVSRPVRELKGFRRIHLRPGEQQTVKFSLSSEDLAFYNERMQYVTEPGKFQVWISPDSVRGVVGEFTVD